MIDCNEAAEVTESMPRLALSLNLNDSRYQVLIGTGGVGSGSFFTLDGNHTLGREESRSGRFLDRKDYCKLHIIAHYVKALTGLGFPVLPVSKVGDDEAGVQLLHEMRDAGIETKYVGVSPGDPTLYSLCFLYPDGSGGNLTTSNAATARVDAHWIEAVEPEFIRYQGRGIALAVPEVPFNARNCLLKMGTLHGFYRVASFTRGDIVDHDPVYLLEQVDLCSVNMDEAAQLAGANPSDAIPHEIANRAIERLCTSMPKITLIITAGTKGSWCWDGVTISYVPAIPVKATGTAGAGDALLAGVLVGLIGGLSLRQSHQLGVLTAACSVTSPHTIDKNLGRQTLRRLANQVKDTIEPEVMNLLA